MKKHVAIAFGKRIIVYDFETNGLWNRLTQPIQVHFRIIEPDGRVWCWESYVSCQWKLPIEVVRLTGITDQLLRERGRPIEEVFRRIKDLLFECDFLLVGQNILRFDNHFLNYYLQKHFTNRYQVGRHQCFDTSAEFKATLLGLSCPDDMARGDWHHRVLYTRATGVSSNLEDACKYYGVQYRDAHTAGGDVAMTHEVFERQVQVPVVPAPGRRGRKAAASAGRAAAPGRGKRKKVA
jgi:DNA polymerase III alpha subunit (gram-positive type)